MKRKLIVSFLVVVFCIGLTMLSKGLRQGVESILEPSLVTATDQTLLPVDAVPQPDAASGTSPAGSPSASSVSAKNFMVFDEVSGTTLAGLTLSFREGDTVAKVTLDALQGDCRVTGTGDSLYFSRILGLAEKSAGPTSGWCYYVNGSKPSVSAGAYLLKAGDVVSWKFLKDGVSQ